MRLQFTALGKALKDVFSRPAPVILAAATTLLMLGITVGLMNYQLFAAIVLSDAYSFSEKLRVVVASLGSLRTGVTAGELAITLATAVLAGINVATLAHYVRRSVQLRAAAGASVLGIAGGLLGIGCASCGSVLLVSLLGLTAASGFLGALPLRGMEFGLVSILILLLSLVVVLKKFTTPLVCKK